HRDTEDTEVLRGEPARIHSWRLGGESLNHQGAKSPSERSAASPRGSFLSPCPLCLCGEPSFLVRKGRIGFVSQKLAFAACMRRKKNGAGDESGAVAFFLQPEKAKSLFRILAAALGGGGRHHGVGHQAGVRAHGLLDRVGDLGIVLEVLLRVLAALADALAI